MGKVDDKMAECNKERLSYEPHAGLGKKTSKEIHLCRK